MNLFSKLFRRNDDNVTATLDPLPPSPLAPVAEEVFVDREPPGERTASVPSKLRRLASMDRTEEGRIAGHTYHDMGICRQMKEGIKAEILCAVGEETHRIGLLVDQLDVEVRRLLGGGMEVTLRELTARREQMERHRMKLHEQQLLVPGNTGFAELPLTSFEAGFKQGYQAYLDATVLINEYLG